VRTAKTDVYTEGVGQLQPRVELWQPWDHVGDDEIPIKALANPFEV